MKGREWYQETDIAQSYEEKRFSRGGHLIDRREKQAVLEALGPVDGHKILEIACGTGRFTTLLASRGARLTSLDISGPMLRQAREKTTNNQVDIEFLRADAARLPFPDDHFDAVFAMRFFHLAHTPASFLSEMARVSREQVFFDTFNRYSARSIYNWLLPMGSRLYSRSEVADLVDGTGLTLAGVSHDFLLPYGLYRQVPDWFATRARRVDRAIVDTRLGGHLASVSYWDTQV